MLARRIGKDAGSAQSIENPADEDRAVGEFRKSSRRSQDARPNAQCQDRGGGCAESRMNLGEFFEEQIVVGHGEKNAWRGEHHAVRGAECGDQNRSGHQFPGPWTEHRGCRGGCDGVGSVPQRSGLTRQDRPQPQRDTGPARAASQARNARGKLRCGSCTSPAL